MNKKTTKPLEQTDKKFEDTQVRDKEENSRKIKERLNKLNITRLNILNRGQKVLLDRGDSKNSRNEDFHLKYDRTKSNRSVEVGIKPVKIITNSVNCINRSEAPARNSKEIYKAFSSNKNVFVEHAKSKPSINCKQTDRKMAEESKTPEKENHPQKICRKNDPTANEKIKNDDQKRTKTKEVITIPYIPAEDSATQMTYDDLSEQTKPILKFGTSKTRNSNTKIAKTVSFKEQSEKSIGSSSAEKKILKVKSSLANFKNKSVYSRTRVPYGKMSTRRKKNCSTSPDKYNINEFPPTEVVKWEPSCLTSATQPYYEAWIDTTLTAFSKCSDEEKLLLEKELIEAFRYLKRPVSPELTYEKYNDEKYTGKIKISRPRS